MNVIRRLFVRFNRASQIELVCELVNCETRVVIMEMVIGVFQDHNDAHAVKGMIENKAIANSTC